MPVTKNPKSTETIYANEAEARTVLELCCKEYDRVTESRGVFTHIMNLCVAYYDEKGKIQGLTRAGILGKSIMAEQMHEELGDLVAVFLEHQRADSKSKLVTGGIGNVKAH